MAPRPRVLALITFQPWPVRSGITRRLDAVLTALSEVSDLEVVVAAEPGAPSVTPTGMRTVTVTRGQGRATTLLELARGARRLQPITMSFYQRRSVRKALSLAVGAHRPDLVFTHGLGGAALCHGLVADDRVVLDADTIDPATYRRIARDLRGLRSLQWSLDAPLVARWHRRNLGGYRAVSVVSLDDVATYKALSPSANLLCVPNGVGHVAPARPAVTAGPLLFVGDLNYPPNMSGLAWFVSAALPLVPQARLRVIGQGRAPLDPRVESVGFVLDLAPEWERALALVVPLRSGGGTRLKVLEALAAGVPVISSAVGAEGLGAEPGRHYLQAETAEEFAAHVARLSSEPLLATELAAEGRALAEGFTWQRCVEPLKRLVRELS